MDLDIANLLKEFAFPIVVAIVLGWFIGHDLWPWVKARFESQDAERNKEREEFILTLQGFQTNISNMTAQISVLAEVVQRLCDKTK